MEAHSSLEDQVGAIWADVLGVDAVGPGDDFFALGGDSVLVAVMTMRIEETYDLVLDPGQIFDTPTLSAFSNSLSINRP